MPDLYEGKNNNQKRNFISAKNCVETHAKQEYTALMHLHIGTLPCFKSKTDRVK